MPDLLQLLHAQACNNAWANLRLFEACKRLSQQEYEAEGVSFFPSIRLTLEHNLEVDRYYIDALEGGGLGMKVRDAEGLMSAELLGEAQRASDLKLTAFCKSLDEAGLERIVELQRAGRIQRESVLRVLQHLFQHQIHHRGQAHALLAGTSVKPPQLDEFFLAEDAPIRAAEFAALGLTEEDVWT
ncbi:DinB family protein [Limibacillus halophilus]